MLAINDNARKGGARRQDGPPLIEPCRRRSLQGCSAESEYTVGGGNVSTNRDGGPLAGCPRVSRESRAGLLEGSGILLRGKNTAVISKSPFGKARTVMAEGGCAAAMGNVNPRDSWQVRFRDTMRGGKFLNNWRMAELHAQEAPDRVWELEAWGAVFDRTPDGMISQRNFGGHEYPRLAHVGDRLPGRRRPGGAAPAAHLADPAGPAGPVRRGRTGEST